MQPFSTLILLLLQSSVEKPVVVGSSVPSYAAEGDEDEEDAPRGRRKAKEQATFPPSLYTFLLSLTDKALAAKKE